MQRRTVLAVLIAAAIGVSVIGCANKNKDTGAGPAAETENTDGVNAADLAEINQSEYISVPKDLSVLDIKAKEGAGAEISDEEIEKELETYRSYASYFEEVTDRDTVQSGDYVNIDFTGTCEGKEFAGGTAADYDLEIGSGAFISGFEDQLIGVKKGNTVDVKCTFPKDYFETELAGKDAVFKTTVNKIEKRVDPELTDKVVADIGITDADGNPISTVDSLRTYIRNYLTAKADYYQTYELRENAIMALIDASKVEKEYPDDVIEAGVNDLISIYGISDDTLTGNYRESLRESAKDYLTRTFAVRAVAKNESIEVSKEDVEAYFKEQYGETVKTDNLDEKEINGYIDSLLEEKVADRILEIKGIRDAG